MFATGDMAIKTKNQAQRFIIGGFDALQRSADDFVITLGEAYRVQTSEILRSIIGLSYSSVDYSFQNTLVPFVIMLTHSKMISNAYPHCSNLIYGCLSHDATRLFDTYIACLEEIIQSEKPIVKDPNAAVFTAVTVTQMALPFLELVYILCTKFPASQFTSMNVTLQALLDITNTWKQRLADGSLYADDLQGIENVFGVNCVEAKLETLIAIQADADMKLELGSILQRQRNQTDKELAVKNSTQKRFDYSSMLPAGSVDGISETPRHDNDFVDISRIQIIPTMDEILSEHAPPIPGNHQLNPDSHWLPIGPARLIDTQFRLLREDMMASLREGISSVLQSCSDKSQKMETGWFRRAKGGNYENSRLQSPSISSDVNVFLYANVKILSIELDRRAGMSLKLRFDCPRGGGNMSAKEFWKNNRRLENGIILCLLCKKLDQKQVRGRKQEYDIFFGTVVMRDANQLADGNTIVMSLAGSNFSPRLFTYAAETGTMQTPHILLEAHKVLYEVYRPILESLKSMAPSLLPFRKYIAPLTAHDGPEPITVNPPLYSRRQGFRFNLNPLLNGERREEAYLTVDSDASAQLCLEELQTSSTMDNGQCKALIGALCSEMVCIQGPPGTGKSYIGVQIVKAIINSIAQEAIGPILVVCFTNHALDQFLGHLLDLGIKSLCRIGGRSNDERMAAYSLNDIRGSASKQGNKQLYSLFKTMEHLTDKFQDTLRLLQKKSLTWAELSTYLEDHHEGAWESFSKRVSGKNGWSVSTGKKKKNKGDIIQYWLHQKMSEPPKKSNRPLEELQNVSDMWVLPRSERQTLYDHWKDARLKEHTDSIKRVAKEMEMINNSINEIYAGDKVAHLRRQTIIGATTTGSAKNHRLIAAAGPRIVICEEAGEVLESHILSALSPEVQHFISIGDHKQLRPHIAEYSLSAESSSGARYCLDVSQFERLQQPEHGFPLYTLDTQRRMRPEFSQLVKNTLYPNLQDSPVVLEYPNVLGMAMNLQFMDHNNVEAGGDASAVKSPCNMFEVGMVVAMATYLLKQGYLPSEVTILTPYLGQLSKIRTALASQFMVFVNELDEAQLAILEIESNLA